MNSDQAQSAGRTGSGEAITQFELDELEGGLVDLASSPEAWLAASVEVKRRLLDVADGVGPVAREIIEHVRRLGRARTVTFVGPSSINEAHFEVRLAAGAGAASLVGNTYEKEHTLEGRAMQENRGFLGTAEDSCSHHLDLEAPEPVGSLLAVPLDGPEEMRGAIVASRGVGQARFSLSELVMTQDFARQSSIALQLAHGQVIQEQLHFREQHDAKVRRVHDDLIQDLFALGVTLESLRRSVDPPTQGLDAGPVWRQVSDRIDGLIRQLRGLLVALPDPDD